MRRQVPAPPRPSPATSAWFPLGLQIGRRQYRSLQLPVPPDAPAGRGTQRLVRTRELAHHLQGLRPPRPAAAAELLALATLNEIFRHLCELRLAGADLTPGALTGSAAPEPVRTGARRFAELFPPGAVLRGEETTPGWLARRQTPSPALQLARELLIHVVQEENPALSGLAFLAAVPAATRPLLRRAAQALAGRAPVAPGPLSEAPLLELLARPLRAAPGSLAAQLAWVRDAWGTLLPPELLGQVQLAIAIDAEEQRRRGGGPGEPQSPWSGPGHEPEAFSTDADWMGRLVLMAKSVQVWLDQLARRYRREITRLDQIPDEELERLARWGFSGLWLIGIWERSPASETIKRRRGNPEAAASAYSLFEYRVAESLGGEGALENLKARAQARGLRLACDVVPNHTGLDSRWIREHPEWFIQRDTPPWPSYRFSGPDLSGTPELALTIEDGYWDHRDAAVVFRHLDRRSGRERFIYHGNDGTHLPWNDTAQLDFLKAEVREAMIGVILEIARRFPIIRFDAAMTLARRHFQRLWYPLPGNAGGVPSRAEHALPQAEFDRLFPVEFWREVVDRVAAEVPDTLLLAEAFWLMEGFFVRTLGMHRVYNSAFMNLLRREENARLRGILKEILAFNPEILRRFVNFLSNPDEATAAEQFGTGERYFGAAVLLATLPGLPMFGHGQVEGWREKYGMEYRRSYWDEPVDEGCLRHHEAQVFPLLHRRALFAGVDQFVLYDFWSDEGINEDVYAFSNCCGDERAVVICHNRHARTRGRLRQGVARRQAGLGESGPLVEPTLGEALGLRDDSQTLYRIRRWRTGEEGLRSGRSLHEHGLELELGPYQYEVLLDFGEHPDPDGLWRMLADQLQGAFVPSLDQAARRLQLPPLHQELVRTQAALTSALAAGAPEAALPEALALLRRAAAYLKVLAAPAEARLRELLATGPRLATLTPRSALQRRVLAAARELTPAWQAAWLLAAALGALRRDGAAPALLAELEALPLLAAGLPADPDAAPLLEVLIAFATIGPAHHPEWEELLAHPASAHFLAAEPAARRRQRLITGLLQIAALNAAAFYGPAGAPLRRELSAFARLARTWEAPLPAPGARP